MDLLNVHVYKDTTDQLVVGQTVFASLHCHSYGVELVTSSGQCPMSSSRMTWGTVYTTSVTVTNLLPATEYRMTMVAQNGLPGEEGNRSISIVLTTQSVSASSSSYCEVLNILLAGKAPEEIAPLLAKFDSTVEAQSAPEQDLEQCQPNANAWLRAIPSIHNDLALEPQEVQVLLKWWLGIPISTADRKCPLCSSALDPDCHHALTCRSGGDIIARHNKLRDCFANLCSKACLSPQLEKGPGLDFSTPADVLVPNWSLSNPAAFDLKVIHPVNTDLILEASLASGNSAEFGEIGKHTKNDQMSELLATAPDPLSKARLLSASKKESGSWLHTLPVTSLGLRMDDNTIRIAIGLRLGTPLCIPHLCYHCGANVDTLGTHGLSCRFSAGCHFRHAMLNDILHRALSSANVPSRLEPTGLDRTDGKRPDGITMVPWSNGRLLVWDATCVDTFAPSHLSMTASEVCAAANQAEQTKIKKYSYITSHAYHSFTPVAFETTGVCGPRSMSFLTDFGRRIVNTTGEKSSLAYLLQRFSVAIQRGNAASVLGTLPPTLFPPLSNGV
eukprot:Em0008g189a